MCLRNNVQGTKGNILFRFFQRIFLYPVESHETFLNCFTAFFKTENIEHSSILLKYQYLY